jgi:hypothetical protein
VSDKKWAEWGELKGVDYKSINSEVEPTPSTPLTPIEPGPITIGSALVNATRVALRSAPSTSATILTRVDKGERV